MDSDNNNTTNSSDDEDPKISKISQKKKKLQTKMQKYYKKKSTGKNNVIFAGKLKCRGAHDYDGMDSDNNENDFDSSSGGILRFSNMKQQKKITAVEFDKNFRYLPALVVVNMDLTLIDSYYQPYFESDLFVQNLKKYFNTVYIWTDGNAEHLTSFIKKFSVEFEDNIYGLRRECKPVEYVRDICRNRKSLCGPSVLIDDNNHNLAVSGYDINIDVRKFYIDDSKKGVLFKSLLIELYHFVLNWYNRLH
jgi:hypothetical protein